MNYAFRFVLADSLGAVYALHGAGGAFVCRVHTDRANKTLFWFEPGPIPDEIVTAFNRHIERNRQQALDAYPELSADPSFTPRTYSANEGVAA